MRYFLNPITGKAARVLAAVAIVAFGTGADSSGCNTYYADRDGDAYGDADDKTEGGATPPTGYVEDKTDCDDGNAAINPAATEICDALDNNCDGYVDEGVQTVWYADADGDGFGDGSSAAASCFPPSGYVADNTDCDDANADIYVGAEELCDGKDDDCDGAIDNDPSCLACNFETYGGHFYLFCLTEMSWADAHNACYSYGYHMLSIADADEDAWANTEADTWSTDRWWIGFNDLSVEGSWIWENGETITYTNWIPGEPNDLENSEDCGQLNSYHPENGWNDEPCDWSLSFVCESW